MVGWVEVVLKEDLVVAMGVKQRELGATYTFLWGTIEAVIFSPFTVLGMEHAHPNIYRRPYSGGIFYGSEETGCRSKDWTRHVNSCSWLQEMGDVIPPIQMLVM